ncbi:hypothetical protein ACFE04_022011 [Oxalis oulophora]
MDGLTWCLCNLNTLEKEKSWITIRTGKSKHFGFIEFEYPEQFPPQPSADGSSCIRAIYIVCVCAAFFSQFGPVKRLRVARNKKSRILKHDGDLAIAASVAGKARCMDLADRYMNIEGLLRRSKSCRLRWTSYLKPGIRTSWANELPTNCSSNTLQKIIASHDDVDHELRHGMPHHLVKEVICSLCGTEKEVSQVCINCGVCMGKYFCEICKLFDDDTSKRQYHCDACGICRTGGHENFFHCNKCGCYYSIFLKNII